MLYKSHRRINTKQSQFQSKTLISVWKRKDYDLKQQCWIIFIKNLIKTILNVSEV